jgi:hypothetical protein
MYRDTGRNHKVSGVDSGITPTMGVYEQSWHQVHPNNDFTVIGTRRYRCRTSLAVTDKTPD